MKKTFTFIVVAILIFNISSAKIFRVGYIGIALTGVDYATLDLAENAATAGDTIQIYGSVSTGTINKRLVIIGFGYNFDVHPGLQAIGTNTPSNTTINFEAGSDGSFVTGVSGNFYVGGSSTPTISNITFQRCYGTFYLYNYQTYSQISNIKIISSVITAGGMLWNAAADYPVTNLQVFNCYIYGFTLYKSATSAVFVNCVTASPTFVGNYFLSLNDAGALVRNCILGGASSSSNINTIFENNFFMESQPPVLPPGSNNRWGQTYTALFTGITSANDNASYHGTNEFDENYFILKAGSPAINGGFDGNNNPTDCGIFGGEAPYVYKPSGVPAVPSIYKLTAPSLNASSNPYNVTISVKSNN